MNKLAALLHDLSILNPMDNLKNVFTSTISLRFQSYTKAAINFWHNYPPARTRGIRTEKFPPLWSFFILMFVRGTGFLSVGTEGWHLSINDVCHSWNLLYYLKNSRQTTLWGIIFLALKFYMFFKQIFQTSSIVSKVIVEIQLFS